MPIFKIYAKLNGNSKTFLSLKDLRADVAAYGKTLYSLTLAVQDGDKYYQLSLLNAANYIISGQLPDNTFKKKLKDGK